MKSATNNRSGSAILTLIRALARETATPMAFAIFLFGAIIIALLPGADLGGRNATIQGLGAMLVAAALHGGLGGAFAPGGIFRSPWLHAQPPSRPGRSLAAAGGTWLALGILMLPVLLTPLWPWSISGGQTHHTIDIRKIEYKPGPPGILRNHGMITITCAEEATAEQIRFSVYPIISKEDYRPIPLVASLDGGPWNPLGSVSTEPEAMAFKIGTPRPLGEIRIRRLEPEGQMLQFPAESIRVLGARQNAIAAWFWPWLAAWNCAVGIALVLALLGSLLSRPVALMTGASWAILALAEPACKPGFPAVSLAHGLASGPDLDGGTGWLPLVIALFCALLLSLRPGIDKGREE